MAQNAVSAASTPAPHAARRRRNGVESRRILIESTLTLLSQGKAPTSVNITALAGLAQPTFYAHFKSVDACVLSAAQYVQGKVLEHRDSERVRRSGAGGEVMTAEGLEASVATWLETATTTGPMLDALDRFQNDETPVGDVVRQIDADIRTEAAERLFVPAATAGVTREHFHEFYLLADITIAAGRTLARRIVDGKLEMNIAVKTLARDIGAMLFVTAASCGGNTDKLLQGSDWSASKG